MARASNRVTTSGKKKDLVESLMLRIIVVEPPPGILWALQLGQDEIVKPTHSTKTCITFDFSVEVVAGSAPGSIRLRGPAIQGRPGKRFVYLRMGAYAGQAGALEGWRAKISVEGINRKLVEGVKAKRSVLEARFAGTAKKGGPACASVPLLGAGWSVA